MRDGMAHEEAKEYLDYNVVCAWIGDTTPIILKNKSIEEINEEY